MPREIICGNGNAILVDDVDYERVNQFIWTIDWNGYAVRMVQVQRQPVRVRKKILLHRFIFGATEGECIDHINRNKLDNRRCNLRLATRQQNRVNTPSVGGKSPYKGVSYDARRRRWIASISEGRKSRRLGRFLTQEDAARAYDEEAHKRWGEFAYLNFPGDVAQQVSAARS